MTQVQPVIMAGGKGTRLWPLSRASAPKQFLEFLGETTLFQKSLARVSDKALYEPPVIVTNSDFRFLVAEQARAVDMALTSILLEPVARNTAPALAAAATLIGARLMENAVTRRFIERPFAQQESELAPSARRAVKESAPKRG